MKIIEVKNVLRMSNKVPMSGTGDRFKVELRGGDDMTTKQSQTVPNLKTILEKETYRITDDGGRFVIVEKFPDSNKINVLNESFTNKDGEFMFKGSKPNIVKAIGELLIEASKI